MFSPKRSVNNIIFTVLHNLCMRRNIPLLDDDDGVILLVLSVLSPGTVVNHTYKHLLSTESIDNSNDRRS